MAAGTRDAACALVSRKFPALAGSRPTASRAGPNEVFTFKGEAEGPGGVRVKQLVRVTVDPNGRILKVVVGR